MLTRDQILLADDLTRERVDVPEWMPPGSKPEDSFVYVRELTASEKDLFEAENFKAKGVPVNQIDFRARLLSRTICDENGKLLFSQKDVQALGLKSKVAADRCANVALRLSAATDEEKDELLGNSKGGQPEDSPSDSPPTLELQTSA